MSNFDLRKYLAENILVTEDKIDMINMINKYAQRIATGEEIQDEFFMDNKEEILQVADEIEKYMNSDIDMDEVKKPSTKMTRRELKEIIKAAFIAENYMDDDAALGDMYYSVYEAEDEEETAEREETAEEILARITGTKLDPYSLAEVKTELEKMYDSLETLSAQEDDEKFKTLLNNVLTMIRQHMRGDRKLDLKALKDTIEKGDFNAFAEFQRSVTEAKDEEKEMDITVDAEEETTDGGEGKLANDSIVVDKKIVSLSSLPQQTRKILDSLETLRAQAEEFGDQKFITQVGNTITFFTRDFVVAGDEPTKAKVDETKESLNEDLTSTITILLAFLIGIPGVPIAGALIMGLINYLFNELPDQRAEAKSLRSYKGPDRQEKVLALAKEIESKLSPGKKRYLKILVNRIGVAKLEDKAREYRELDRYASSQKSQMDRGLDENLNADIEAALEDLPVPTDMENDKEFLNESVAFPMWNKIK